MAVFEFQQPRFTEGVLAKSLQGRSSEEFYTYGVKTAQNMIPLLEGPMIKRPGTLYISEAENAASRLFPFYKGGTEAYVIEIGYDNSASDTVKTNCTSSGSPATTITLGGGQSTSDLFVGQHVWGTGIDNDTTAYPTTKKDSSTQIASISTANTTTFTLTNPVTSALSSDTLNFSNKPFIRIYSQDRLLSVQGTTTPYIVKSHRWVTNSVLDEIPTINASQSGDVLFFACPTRKPFLLTRTLDETNASRAEDNSIWTISEYDSEDGPYGNVNAENTLSMLITGTETEEEIGDVQFDVKNNLVIVANHGLQTGQRINLHVNNTNNSKTGNTQIIIKDGTVDPTITVSVTPNATDNKFTTTKSHGLEDNDIIHVAYTSNLTGGTWASESIDNTTDLYVVTARLYTFQLASSEGGDALTFTGVGSGVYFGTNKASDGGAFQAGDKLIGDSTMSSPDWTTADSNKDNYFYVVYSTSVSFQISNDPNNKAFDINYQDLDAAVPPVLGTQFTGKITLKRRKFAKDSDITLTSRVNVPVTGWDNTSSSNGGQTFTDSDIGRLVRLNPLADTSTRRGGIRWSWGIITAVNANGYQCTVNLKTDLSPNPDTTNGTPEWRFGAFSGFSNYSTGVFTGNGYPKISQIYQQRFVFASTVFEPSTVWLSRTGNFYNFAPTELSAQDTPVITGGITSETIVDSNALTFTIDSDTLDEIMWIIDSKKMALGTSAGVYFLYGTETNLAVTPTRFTVSRETSYSATTIEPVIVSNVIIYPQRGGREVQELEFSGAEDQWLQSRISMKAYDMISTSSIIKVAWQERPNPIVWFVLDYGQVLTLSYDRSVKFKAWSSHTFGGAHDGGIAKVTDIAIIPRTDYDQVWFKIKRTIDGSEVSYIETLDRFPSENAITRNELIFLDSSKIHRTSAILSGTPLVNGLHEISALVNGASQTGTALTVDGLTAAPPVGTKLTIAGDSTVYAIAASPASTTTSLKLDQSLSASPADNAIISIKSLTVDGATTAPPANTRFLIAGDTTVYKVVSATTTLWVLDQALASTAANDAAIELRLQQLTMAHLEGQSVGLCTNGMEHVNKTVASDIITLDHALASTAISGLSYTAQMETLSPPTPDNQYTFNKRLLTLTALIQDSLGIEVEYNETTEEFLFRSTQQNTGQPIDFFNGFKKSSLSGIGWDAHSVIIRSISPLPMQINALSIELETGGA